MTRCFPEALCVYCWFYLISRRAVMKPSTVGFFGGDGATIYGHAFKLFPFGFWFVWNENGGRSRQFALRRMEDSSPFVSAPSRLALDLWPLQSLIFPEAPLNDGMRLVADQYVSQAAGRQKQGKARSA